MRGKKIKKEKKTGELKFLLNKKIQGWEDWIIAIALVVGIISMVVRWFKG